MTTHTLSRRGRPRLSTKKECPVHTLLDQATKKKFDAVISRRQESQACFVRRAVLDLLEREHPSSPTLTVEMENALKEVISRDAHLQVSKDGDFRPTALSFLASTSR